jgi:hypothetical protein
MTMPTLIAARLLSVSNDIITPETFPFPILELVAISFEERSLQLPSDENDPASCLTGFTPSANELHGPQCVLLKGAAQGIVF